MKILLTFIIGISITVCSAQKRDNHPRMQQYFVNSDVEKTNLPTDQFLLKGNVKMMSSALPLDGVMVSSGKDGKYTTTDSTGFFEINFSDTVKTVYFYKEGWYEFELDRYKFRARHEIDLTVYMAQSLKQQKMRKPVIYMYSEKVMENVSVKINPKGDLTHTYPMYDDKWEVSLNGDGNIQHKGKVYPYLFWEASTEQLSFKIKKGKIEGTVVAQEELTSFFEKSLTAMGLNAKERTDFITYWVPEMTSSPYYLIQFLNTEDCMSKVGELTIKPAADELKRVFMLAAPLNNQNEYKPSADQEFTPINRKGFTVVEWGGSIIELKVN